MTIEDISAQSSSEDYLRNLRSREFTADKDTLVLDSLSILEISFVPMLAESEERLDTSQYTLDWANGLFILRDNSLAGSRLKFVYRVFPFRLESEAFHKSTGRMVQYNADSFYFNPYYYRPSDNLDQAAIEWGQLNYTGSFARGVSFGNSQSLALNSELDLQLTGYIGRDVEITAVLTDNNIPIQPSGNTAQIQDFDQVFIQVRKGKHVFIAGDYEVREEDGYFMRYYKQLQGASYQGEFDIMDDLSLASSISFSIAKGQFTRNSFNGREGNQGPYRLTGANGETFIIILAGSEKVYIDNVLLRRGEDYDYVMDYNAGEIVFTPNYLITKDSRIVVEFEYADRNYFRSFIETRHTLKYKDLKTHFKFFNEQDNKNNPINISLDEDDRALLASIGDDLDKAFISGVNEVDYSADRVLYRLADTVVNTVTYDSIYIFSTDEDLAVYSLSFTYLGPGKGNYEPDVNSANGRVFKWVAPDLNGNPTGSYEAILLLITPKKKQLMSLGLEYDLKEKWSFEGEVALSNNDLNRFSSIDSDDDKDLAAEAAIQYRSKIGTSGRWQMRARTGYEYKGDDFREIEPYRPVEFRRDWNLALADSAVKEHFVYGQLNFNSDHYDLGYRFTTFQRQGIYTGYRNSLSIQMEKRGWRFKSDASLLNTSTETTNSFFSRPKFTLEKDAKFWKGMTFGIGGTQEYNRVTAPDTDSLLAQSFVFHQLDAFIRSSDTSKVGWKARYSRRTDKEDKENEFRPATVGSTLEINGNVRALNNQVLKWQLTYRNLQVRDSLLTDEEEENTVLGRMEYGFNVKRGAIRYSGIYELGSGQERQRDFTYLPVPPGEGVFSWIDQNDDGLQQQNEFVVSEFSDSASYIRVFTNYNEFVQTHVTRFDQSLQLNPKIAWLNESGIKGFVARFSLQSSTLISKKSLRDEGSRAFNPFVLTSGENNIIVVNASIRNALYFNRSSPVYKISYIQSWSQNKVLLLNGIDSRQISGHRLESHWNIREFISVRLDGGYRNSVANSEFFDSDDYDIDELEVGNGVEYTWKTRIRTAVNYSYANRLNAARFGGEQARVHELGWDFKFSLVGKSTLLADFRYVQIAYNGESGSKKTYEILRGLKPGKNYLWNFRFDQKLSRNIQLILQYEGRKSGSGKVVNVGRAQVRAFF
jgi:hypothetical protein